MDTDSNDHYCGIIHPGTDGVGFDGLDLELTTDAGKYEFDTPEAAFRFFVDCAESVIKAQPDVRQQRDVENIGGNGAANIQRKVLYEAGLYFVLQTATAFEVCRERTGAGFGYDIAEHYPKDGDGWSHAVALADNLHAGNRQWGETLGGMPHKTAPADGSIREAVLMDIFRERQRQADRFHGDAEYINGELAKAAAAYALRATGRSSHVCATIWPWRPEFFKHDGTKRRMLTKAAALIVAEIERLERAEN